MNVQELLWKYAEGDCSPKEKAEVERLLNSDTSLRQELALITQTQAALKNLEPEQPSMRFTQNVMEALPHLYSVVSAEPLVKPFWKKAFWIAVAGVLAGLIYFLRAFQPSKSDFPVVDQVADSVSSVFEKIPVMAMQYFVLLLLAVGTLAILDRTLGISKQNRISKG